jgi:hypothetical protein
MPERGKTLWRCTMKRLLSISFLALLAGCTVGVGYQSPGRYPGQYPDRDPNGAYGYDDRVDELRGTVASVNTRERLIYIDQEGTDDRDDPRNDDDAEDTAVFSYDEGTVVRYQGQTFRPQDLERGDRIQASVDRNGNRLFAQEIEVLYDVSRGTGGPGGYDPRRDGPRGDDSRGDDSRGDDSRGDNPGRYDPRDDDSRDDDLATDLRGTVRSIDIRSRTLEIDPSGYGGRGSSSGPGSRISSAMIAVRYDADTTVRYQGRTYSPENIERGDEVRIQAARGRDGRLLAQEIVVVGEDRP